MTDYSKVTKEEAIEHIKACTDVLGMTGFLYFAENFVKVSHPTKGAVSFGDDMYKWQRDACKEFISNRFIISKKVRQVGYSTLTGAYALWRALFFESQSITILSLTQRDSIEFLNRIKFMYEKLPVWLKQKTDMKNKTSISFEHNSSKIVAIPNSGESARGGTMSLLILDEYASMKNQEDVKASAMPTLALGAMEPFTNKTLPSQLFIISTLPKYGTDNDYLRMLRVAQDDEENGTRNSEFKLVTVDTSDIPFYNNPVWHKSMLDMLGERLYKLEILGEEVYDVENSLIPHDVLDAIKTETPIRVDFVDPNVVDDEGYLKDYDKMMILRDMYDPSVGYMRSLWIWEDPIPGRDYIVVADVGTGRAEDYSAFIVIDLDAAVQVAELKERVNTEYFKEMIHMIAEYYNNAKVCIENNGLGAPINEYFATTLCYSGLYWTNRKTKSTPGIGINQIVKANGASYMQGMLMRGEIEIKSKRLLSELRFFGHAENGKLKGLYNNHDDLVMCLVMYALLVNQGWAISSERAYMNTMFGSAIKSSLATQTGVKKYWETIESIADDDEKEWISDAKSMGLCMPDVHENAIKYYIHNDDEE